MCEVTGSCKQVGTVDATKDVKGQCGNQWTGVTKMRSYKLKFCLGVKVYEGSWLTVWLFSVGKPGQWSHTCCLYLGALLGDGFVIYGVHLVFIRVWCGSVCVMTLYLWMKRK